MNTPRSTLRGSPLYGKRVIITGASSGIGEALAGECVQLGMHVGLVARRLDLMQQIAERLRDQHPQGSSHIEAAELDLTQRERIAPVLSGLADLLGGVDVVIANAGLLKGRNLGDGRTKRDRDMFEVNVFGAIETAETAINLMRAQGHGGHLVVVSSFGALVPLPGNPAYCATKAAIAAYFNGMRASLEKDGIDVTVAYPGFVKTDLLNHAAPRGLPLMGRTEDIAREIMQAVAQRQAEMVGPGLVWRLLYQAQHYAPQALIRRLQRHLP